MSKIVKNTTGSTYDVNDVGISIAASSQYTIPPQDYLLWAASDDVITGIGSGDLVINDGSSDLSINDGTKLIQGIFPNPVGIEGSDGTQIGNVGDSLKTITSFEIQNLTAFGRLKASLPTVIAEGSFVENERNDLFDTNTAGGATITYDSTEKTRNLNVGTASGDKAILQTFKRVKYTPGQQNAVIFVNHFQPRTNVLQCACYGDESDGFIFQMNGTQFEVVIRSSASGSVVENTIPQSNFNIDKLDGTGPSGITADFAKPIIFFIQFQWLGAGSVYFFAAIEDKIVLMHRKDHSGIISNTKYMRTATLPFRYEIENLAATAGSTTFKISCFSSISEGTKQSVAVRRHVRNPNERSLNNSNFLPMIAIRLKSSSDIANLKPIRISLLGTSNDPFAIELVIGGSLSGGSWSSVDADSSAEVNYTATSHTGGIVIDGNLAAEEINQTIDLDDSISRIGKFIDGTSQILVLRAISLKTNADAFCSMTFEEIY